MQRNVGCDSIAAILASLSVTRSLYTAQRGVWKHVLSNTRYVGIHARSAAGRIVACAALAFLMCHCLAGTLQFRSGATIHKISLGLSVNRPSQKQYPYVATSSGSPVMWTSPKPSVRQFVAKICLVDINARGRAGNVSLAATDSWT